MLKKLKESYRYWKRWILALFRPEGILERIQHRLTSGDFEKGEVHMTTREHYEFWEEVRKLDFKSSSFEKPTMYMGLKIIIDDQI